MSRQPAASKRDLYLLEWQGNPKNDFKGGISAGIITLPIALAFGQASGLGPMAGLYGAVIIGIIGTILGGTKTQVSAPVGVLLVMVTYISTSFIKELNPNTELLDSPELLVDVIPYILLTFIIAGILQILFGVLKIGSLIQYLPYPVVSGFSTGVGILIIFLQLQHLFDTPIEIHKDFHLLELLRHSDMIELEQQLILASTAILMIVAIGKFNKSLPAALITIVVLSVVANKLGWMTTGGNEEKEIMHEVKYNPAIWGIFLKTKMLTMCLGFGFSLALVSSINTLLTSLAADNLTGDSHQSNRELIAQGIGNTIIGLFGAMPSSGAIACTVNNINNGGRSRLSSMISTSVLLFALVLGTQLIELVPVAVLEGILIYIGYIIIDKKSFKHIRSIPKMDTAIMLMVAILTAGGQLLYAVLAGLSIASIHFMKKMADVVELDTKYAKVDRLIDSLIDTFDSSGEFRKQVLIKNIKGPIFFGFASRFSKSLKLTEEVKVIVINMGNVPYIDQSGLYTLEREIKKLRSKKLTICLAELTAEVRQMLSDICLIPELVHENYIFSSVEECVVWLREPGHIDGELDMSSQEVYIPSAFTPNGDGQNDDWDIKNINLYPDCQVQVFTREGQEVFQSDGYDTPWNGKFENKMLPVDKYKYVIKLGENGGQQTKEGYVSIFR